MPSAVAASDPFDLNRPDPSGLDRSDARTRAVILARAGGLLGPGDLLLILGLSKSAYHRFAKAGAFDKFLVHQPLGTRKYSGALICRWLDGEDITRTFAAPRGSRK